jgi:hypothetical protein
MAGVEPTFAEMADELLAWVRHEAALNEFAEPFLAAIPVSAPGIRDAHARMQRRLMIFAAAHKRLAEMASFEALIRALMQGPRWKIAWLGLLIIVCWRPKIAPRPPP